MRWTIGTCLLLVILDQATKLAALAGLSSGLSRPVVEGFFYLTLVKNPGIAFGLFPQYSRLFVFLSFATILLIVILYRKVFRRSSLHQVSGGLILGGAFGNLIDRILYGHVVDFLDFRLRGYRWPAFNLADSAICVGVGLLAILLLVTKDKPANG